MILQSNFIRIAGAVRRQITRRRIVFNLGVSMTFDFEKFSQSMAEKGLPIKNAKKKIWVLEGYLLRQKLSLKV
jgi:hypothetical protein